MRYRLPLLIALAAALGAGCVSAAPSPTGPVPTTPAVPPTLLVTLDGTTTDLAAVIRGRAAVINFWATWCDACVREIDAFKRLEVQANARGDALVVGVAVGERRETVAAFARRSGLRYAQLVDEDYRLADALGERRVPATLVVDRHGRIIYRGGALDAGVLAAFRSVLDEP
jgi:peroxiredoxin